MSLFILVLVGSGVVGGCAFVWTGGEAMMCGSDAGVDDLGFGSGVFWWRWCLIWAAEAPRLMTIRW